MPTLLIHPRRGLYQITSCKECGFGFGCDNCDTKLTTYRAGENYLQMMCHQCQSFYNYPISCPKCGAAEIVSKYGGIDELAELLEKEFCKTVIRLDKGEVFTVDTKSNSEIPDERTVGVTTRVFDPAIDYQSFDKIIFVHAENLMAGSDYLTAEESYKNLTELLLRVRPETEVVFDTITPDNAFFAKVIQLDHNHPEKKEIMDWYSDFLINEKDNRQKYEFPPFRNLILLTSHEKTTEKALVKINTARKYLIDSKSQFSEVNIGTAYRARFLRRKGLYSFHLLLKFPRQYTQYDKLKQIVKFAASSNGLQVRLNPRNLF